MSVLDIAQIGHPVLREPARALSAQELATPEMQRLIDDMIDTMRHASGAGIAANQVHRPVRVCVIEVGDNPRYPYKPRVPLTVLVNPELAPIGDATFSNYEGCLSVPNLRGRVERRAELRVRALDRHGAPIDEVVRGVTAGTYQHEADHLDGTLFVDRVADTRTLCTWDEFRAHHEAAFVADVRRVVDRYGS